MSQNLTFRLWREYGARNSGPVFDALAAGIKSVGCSITTDENYDIDVIWSVLFAGRMSKNKQVWDRAQQQNRKVLVLEVGGIKRGHTWKVGLNGINRDANFGPSGQDETRAQLLGLDLHSWRKSGDHILICGQHDKSLQWKDMPTAANWTINIIETIKRYTNRQILVRPHPRCQLELIEKRYKNVRRQQPKMIKNTYDDFDLGFNNLHALINWSSNPAPQAVINGVPVFTGPSSLAWDVANKDLSTIDNPLMPDRQQWLNDYAWTEFTLNEISSGIPLKRIFFS